MGAGGDGWLVRCVSSSEEKCGAGAGAVCDMGGGTFVRYSFLIMGSRGLICEVCVGGCGCSSVF